MIYKFKSPATGDVIMLGPQGDQLLQLLGRLPAAKGIIEPADMPAAMAALQAAVDAEDKTAEEQPQEGKPRTVALRQRVWPMLEMLKRAHAADEPVTWGV